MKTIASIQRIHKMGDMPLSPIFLIVYVDDMLLSSRNAEEVAELARQL